MAEKEYIERDAVLDLLTNRDVVINPNDEVANIREDVECLPAADVRTVVLCRDCKHEGLLSCPIVVIEKQQMVFINHDPEFFCASGERENANV